MPLPSAALRRLGGRDSDHVPTSMQRQRPKGDRMIAWGMQIPPPRTARSADPTSIHLVNRASGPLVAYFPTNASTNSCRHALALGSQMPKPDWYSQ